MEKPLVSFCISTYKRPDFIRNQVNSLLGQTVSDFNIVISDNDPLKSAEPVVIAFEDERISYEANDSNLGMIKSFNKSIARSTTDYIVMITDDDPLAQNFLEKVLPLIKLHPEYTVYAGVTRKNKSKDSIERFSKDEFAYELINPNNTEKCLWSNCIIKRDAAIAVGCIPDYGSPHLADHAFLALCGSVNGGLMINTDFGDHNSHAQSFSMGNIPSYYLGCKGFYEVLSKRFINSANHSLILKAITHNLTEWFIVRSFFLRRTFFKNDRGRINELNQTDELILKLPFMKGIIVKYWFKRAMFFLKSGFL